MAEVNQITITNGIPTSGNGEVATINALMADGGQETLGFTTDSANVNTDSSSVSMISILKQISKIIQAIELRWPATLTTTGGLKIQGDGTALPVQVSSIPSHAVTNSGTFPVQITSGRTVTTTLTPTGGAYGANDVLSGVLTFASIANGASDIVIEGISLMINRSTVIASESSYRLYLYSSSPPSALADNAVWDLPSGDRTVFQGYVDITIPVDLGSTVYVEINNLNKRLRTSSSNIFGYLITVPAFTDTSDLHTITLRVRSV